MDDQNETKLGHYCALKITTRLSGQQLDKNSDT
jgi:hypothetical protein